MTSSGEAPGEAVELCAGVFQLPTDYPQVCNAPLWAYLIADGDRFALVDPGVRSTLQATLAGAVRSTGLDLDGAELLLATHGHPDHSGGQRSWRDVAPAARVAAPLEDAPWVESFDRQWVRFWDDYPGTLDLRETREAVAALCVPEPTVELFLRDGDRVALGSRTLRVVQTRGHTWGHCAYLDESSGALFTGDAAQGHGVSECDGQNVIAPLYLDVAEARAGLRRLLGEPFRLLCPAHVPPMERAAGIAFLEDSLAFIDEVDELARELVRAVAPAALSTRRLVEAIADLTGTHPAVTPQTVPTARAHLYALAREGLLEAAWLPVGGRDRGEEAAGPLARDPGAP
jgi:glyoxylase-like metal-dependent hydrolase (beta-lactamase superfamily II)